MLILFNAPVCDLWCATEKYFILAKATRVAGVGERPNMLVLKVPPKQTNKPKIKNTHCIQHQSAPYHTSTSMMVHAVWYGEEDESDGYKTQVAKNRKATTPFMTSTLLVAASGTTTAALTGSRMHLLTR